MLRKELSGVWNECFMKFKPVCCKAKESENLLHKDVKMSELDNMNVIEVMERQAWLKVWQGSSARLIGDWLHPILPEIGMSEEKYKRVLFENSIESIVEFNIRT